MLPLPIGHLEDQWNHGTVFTLDPDTRRKHMALFGSTGAGKSTLIKNMILWDINHGMGVTVSTPASSSSVAGVARSECGV